MPSSSTSSSERATPRGVARWLRDLAISAVVALLLFEGLADALGMLGVALPSRYPRPYGPDARFVFAGEYFRFPEFENDVALNKDGFHDWERACPKPQGTTRIAVWGDSMVEGFQVRRDALFTAQLEEALRTEERPVEVANLGFSGGRVSTLLDPRVQERLATCGVDALLIEVHGAMELPFQAAGSAPGPLPGGWAGFPRSRFGRIRERLVTEWGLDGLYLLTEKVRMIAGTAFGGTKGGKSLYDTTADWNHAWANLRTALQGVLDATATRGMRVALFYVPSWPEVVALRADHVRTTAGGVPVDYGQLRDHTVALAAELGLPVVDLSPAFREAGEKTHFESDRHWTPIGQRRAFAALLPFVRANLLGR